jgi:hypothetical protein
VSELLASEHVYMGLAGTLPKLCDLDALLAQVRRGVRLAGSVRAALCDAQTRRERQLMT